MSDVLSEDGVRELLETIPHAEAATVERAGHQVAGDRNDAFLVAVTPFLERWYPADAAGDAESRGRLSPRVARPRTCVPVNPLSTCAESRARWSACSASLGSLLDMRRRAARATAAAEVDDGRGHEPVRAAPAPEGLPARPDLRRACSRSSCATSRATAPPATATAPAPAASLPRARPDLRDRARHDAALPRRVPRRRDLRRRGVRALVLGGAPTRACAAGCRSSASARRCTASCSRRASRRSAASASAALPEKFQTRRPGAPRLAPRCRTPTRSPTSSAACPTSRRRSRPIRAVIAQIERRPRDPGPARERPRGRARDGALVPRDGQAAARPEPRRIHRRDATSPVERYKAGARPQTPQVAASSRGMDLAARVRSWHERSGQGT